MIWKKVEKASEFAVSKAFSATNSNLSRRLWSEIVDLETSEQIEDHDEVYAEGKKIRFCCSINSSLEYSLLKHNLWCISEYRMETFLSLSLKFCVFLPPWNRSILEWTPNIISKAIFKAHFVSQNGTTSRGSLIRHSCLVGVIGVPPAAWGGSMITWSSLRRSFDH